MLGRVTVDDALTILSIIGEEDSIGFEDDEEVQEAIEVLQTKIEDKLRNKQLKPGRVIVAWASTAERKAWRINR